MKHLISSVSLVLLLMVFNTGTKATPISYESLTCHFSIPNDTPNRFHKLLARSNGDWIGDASLWISPDKPPLTSTSRLTNTMAMNGLFQVSEITINLPGSKTPSLGLRITGFNAAKNVFTRAMIGNDNGAQAVSMEGPWDEATQSFTMPFKRFNSQTGKYDELKEVYRIIDENTEILEIYGTDPQTSKEYKMLSVKWTRKK